jgi:Fic family protein
MPGTYIWQHPDWPKLRYEAQAVSPALSDARKEQGKVLGMFQAVGISDKTDVEREIWTGEAVATSAIEGEKLDLEAVRSSVMRRLGGEDSGGRVDRNVDGLLDLMQDATNSHREKLDDDRLKRWHSALFPGGTTGIRRISAGQYRSTDEPMQIVSGPVGREAVHYEAPRSSDVPGEMGQLLAWWEETRTSKQIDGIVRAAIAHLWFETIHPFEDGNGRVGRAIADMALAQDVGSPQRFYSLSRQLMTVRNAYYDSINAAQRGTLDITSWVSFFLEQFRLACVTSQQVVEAAIVKSRFWAEHAQHTINDRQRKVVKRILDAGDGGFEGGMSAEKYGNLAGVSKATATRDLGELLKAGYLIATGEGRATRYWVNVPGWSTGG